MAPRAVALFVACLFLVIHLKSAAEEPCEQPMATHQFTHLVEKIENAALATDVAEYLEMLSREGHHNIKGGMIRDDDEAVAIASVITSLNQHLGEDSGEYIIFSQELASAAMKKQAIKRIKNTIGPKGTWSTGCPVTYTSGGKYGITRAELIGHLDGLILGKGIKEEKPKGKPKLKTALNHYYKDAPASRRRKSFLCQDEEMNSLLEDVVKSCEDMRKAANLGKNGLPVRFGTIKDCKAIRETVKHELQMTFDLQHGCAAASKDSVHPNRGTRDVHGNTQALVQGGGHPGSVKSTDAKSTDCKMLANTGDCSFHQCVESEYQECGEDGLALGYALPYCTRFDTFMNDFTSEGQDWIRASRTCMMTGILPHYRTVHLHHRCQFGACSSLTETTLQMIPECYLDSGPGLCEVLKNAQNWQALVKVFEMDGFGREHFAFTFQQVADAMHTCLCGDKDAWSAIQEHMKNMPDYVVDFYQTNTIQAQPPVTPECEEYANQGDCRFYECLEQRFPCKTSFYSGHFADFELPSCTEFHRNADLLDSDGMRWLVDSQSCLMQALLPLYNSDEMSCAEMHSLMFEQRIDCFVGKGFCGLMENNDWAFDQCTQTNGFPTYMPAFARPLTFGDDLKRLGYYYRTVVGFQRLLTNIGCECYNQGEQATMYWYSVVYSKQCDCQLRIKNQIKN